MHAITRLFYTLLVSGYLSLVCDAMQANPEPFDVQQPDGSMASIFLRGNEHFNFLEDTMGFRVIETQLNGDVPDSPPLWVYASRDQASGAIVPSQIAVGSVADPMAAAAMLPEFNPVLRGSNDNASPFANTNNGAGAGVLNIASASAPGVDATDSYSQQAQPQYDTEGDPSLLVGSGLAGANQGLPQRRHSEIDHEALARFRRVAPSVRSLVFSAHLYARVL